MIAPITAGSTAAPSWLSALLNSGLFSNESRIPMANPFPEIAAPIRPRSESCVKQRLTLHSLQLGSNVLKLLDQQRFGEPRFAPLPEGRQRHHGFHVGFDFE